MKLWVISQKVNNDYDTYDSAVVAAETMEDARRIHPFGEHGRLETWATPESVSVEYLGEAKDGTAKSVICASFNAG